MFKPVILAYESVGHSELDLERLISFIAAHMQLPIPEFKVLLYGPGLPPAGIKARAHFEDSVLVIQGKGHWFTIQGEKLSLKTGGYDGRQWLLTWITPSGVVTAMLQGNDAVQAFIKLAPPVVSAELKRAHLAHGQRGLVFRIGIALLALFLFAVVVGAGLFWIYEDAVGRWAADRVSQEQKVRMGDVAFDQMRPTLDLVERGAVRETVEFIGVRVTTGSRNRYVFHVAESPKVNSFALPGGHVIIYTGLLQNVRSAEELAAILAHEASHIEKRHALRNIIRALGWQAVLAAAVGDFSSHVWQNMAQEMERLSYSLEQEREADRESLIMLKRAGVSPDGLVPFVTRMSSLEGGQDHSVAAGKWAAHPADQGRLNSLREQIATQSPYQSQPLPVDWSRFQRALAD